MHTQRIEFGNDTQRGEGKDDFLVFESDNQAIAKIRCQSKHELTYYGCWRKGYNGDTQKVYMYQV